MKVIQIRDDVWKFKGGSSVYLIKGEKNILIDAGDADDKKELSVEVSKVLGKKKVDVVLLTHMHYDHIGNLDLFGDAEIFASSEEIEDYEKNARGFYFYVDEKVDVVVQEAKSLGEENFGLNVLESPGHTRGSVAFLDKERKLLFSGDTIFGGGIQGRIDLPNSVPEKMDKSTRMLRKLVAEEGFGLCPGHGYWEDSQE